MAPDFGSLGDVHLPIGLDIIGMIPEGAAGGIIKLSRQHILCEAAAVAPGAGVPRFVALTIAPPRELAAPWFLLAAIGDDPADVIGKARVRDPVHHHLGNRQLAVLGLAARLVVDVEAEAIQVIAVVQGHRKEGELLAITLPRERIRVYADGAVDG